MSGNRGKDGKFLKGKSGNPSGHPPALRELALLARTHGVEAIERLVTLMRSAEDENIRLRACEVLLNRGYGLPNANLNVVIDGQLAIGPSIGLLPPNFASLSLEEQSQWFALEGKMRPPESSSSGRIFLPGETDEGECNPTVAMNRWTPPPDVIEAQPPPSEPTVSVKGKQLESPIVLPPPAPSESEPKRGGPLFLLFPGRP